MVRLKRFTKRYAENSCVWCRRILSDSISVQKERFHPGATARVERSGDLLRIYSADLKVLLATHAVTWSRTDSFCEGQYESLAQPEEFPTAPVQTQILQFPKPSQDLSFAKFDFDKEEQV